MGLPHLAGRRLRGRFLLGLFMIVPYFALLVSVPICALTPPRTVCLYQCPGGLPCRDVSLFAVVDSLLAPPLRVTQLEGFTLPVLPLDSATFGSLGNGRTEES